MGHCPTVARDGCGQAHPPIVLDRDSFPEDLPWHEVIVLPPGALLGMRAAQWRQLLQRHAALTPEEALQTAMGVAVRAARALLEEAAEQPPHQAQQPPQQAQQGQRQKRGGTRAQQAPRPGRSWDRRWVCDCGVRTASLSCGQCGRTGPCR